MGPPSTESGFIPVPDVLTFARARQFARGVTDHGDLGVLGVR